MTFTSTDFVFLLPGESLEDMVWVPKCICDLLYQLRALPWWHRGEEPACNAGDPDSIPGLGRSPGKGNGKPLQCSCLGNPMDRGVWQATAHGVTKESDTTQ